MAGKLTSQQHEAVRKLIFVFVGLALAVLIIFKAQAVFTGNVIKDDYFSVKGEYKGWLVDNCECLEKNYVWCPEGFEISGNVCRGNGTFTYRFRSCSKYDCNGEINELNLETLQWEIK